MSARDLMEAVLKKFSIRPRLHVVNDPVTGTAETSASDDLCSFVFSSERHALLLAIDAPLEFGQFSQSDAEDLALARQQHGVPASNFVPLPTRTSK